MGVGLQGKYDNLWAWINNNYFNWCCPMDQPNSGIYGSQYFCFISFPGNISIWPSSYYQNHQASNFYDQSQIPPKPIEQNIKTTDQIAGEIQVLPVQPPLRREEARSTSRKAKSQLHCQDQKQYKPYERKCKKKMVKLKENRNVLPIKIRQILSFLTRQNKSSQFVVRIFEHESYRFIGNLALVSIKRFYSYLKNKKSKIGNYVKQDALHELIHSIDPTSPVFSSGEQQFYNRVVRTVINYYLNNLSILATLNSNRIISCKKVDHLKVQRYLIEYIKGKETDGNQ